MPETLVWLGVALALGGCASAPPPPSKPSPLLGDVMPGFESKTLNGNELHSTGFHGNAIVVTFASSECDRCERSLAAAQEAYGGSRELVVVGVFRPTDAHEVRAISARLDLKFPIVLDADGSIARRFLVKQWPSTFVVDASGRVRWVGGADVTEDSLARAIAASD